MRYHLPMFEDASQTERIGHAIDGAIDVAQDERGISNLVMAGAGATLVGCALRNADDRLVELINMILLANGAEMELAPRPRQ